MTVDEIADRLSARKSGNSYKAKCPAHDDREPSLSLDAGKTGGVVLHCHAGCEIDAICDALGIKKADLCADEPESKVKTSVVELATLKKLDASYLRALGLRDLTGGGVAIPYYDAEGKIIATKKRLFRDGGHSWIKDARTPYGLDRLVVARELDYLILCEGESDCWTLWHHEMAALGIPGANRTNVIERDHVAGIATIYVVNERDKGAKSFLPGVAKRLAEIGYAGEVLELKFSGVKDPSELHIKDPLMFNLNIGRVMSQVQPLNHTQNGDDSSSAPDGALPFRFAADIPMVPITWLWKGYIAAGMLSVLDGDPDLGKSTLLADLTARITSGRPMPGEDIGSGAAGVVLISFEEHQGAVMTPRLVAAAADRSRVAIWNLDEVPFNLVDSLATLGDLIRHVNAKLVVIDPLMAALPPSLNAHRDQDVRTVLAPLSNLAETTGAAILLVRHLNKQAGGAALYRGGGSIGIIAAARTGLTLARDPKLDDSEEDDGSRILAVSKCNVGKKGASMRLRVVSAPSPGPGIEVARAEWGGACKDSADSLLVPREERGQIDRAMKLIRDLLKDGPQPVAAVQDAMRANGFSPATEQRARAKLGAKARSESNATGKRVKWWLHMPDQLVERKGA